VKKMVQRSMGIIIVFAMLISLMMNYWLQISTVQHDMDASSRDLFWQINQILQKNTAELQEIQQQFAENCLAQARTAAYLVEHDPSLLSSQEEIEKMVGLLQDVDELHFFDETGRLYAGSETIYIGFTFDSGEQMRFFQPMLQDRTLELCQDIMPNTAEGKLMQYAAVWREDGKGIVQVGMEPHRVLEATKKNELSYIFSLLTEDDGSVLYAADPETFQILGSTQQKYVGKTLTDLGIDTEKIVPEGAGFFSILEYENSYCFFEQKGSVLLGRICTLETLYQNVNENTLLLAIYLLLLGMVLVYGICHYLDKNIVSGIEHINAKLQTITDGDLDEQVDVCTTPEFIELSGHINRMVQSLLASTEKLSSVLDVVQLPIGAYEYNRSMKRVRCTKRLPEILGLKEEEQERLLSDYCLFEERIQKILLDSPEKLAPSVFCLRTEHGQLRYLKLESFLRDSNVLGIVLDVTKDVEQLKKTEQERDEDLLTGLQIRRSFYAHLEELFCQSNDLGYAAMMIIDADNLKFVNDNYGHEMGDCYLKGISDLLAQPFLSEDGAEIGKRLVARLGGDEFAIFLYGCQSVQELEECLSQLRRRQNDTMISMGETIHLSLCFSMGYAICPQEGADYHTLLKIADEKMYREKRLRKQTFHSMDMKTES
jgi:diguanylate cyclase (GGDEF)-like protein